MEIRSNVKSMKKAAEFIAEAESLENQLGAAFLRLKTPPEEVTFNFEKYTATYITISGKFQSLHDTVNAVALVLGLEKCPQKLRFIGGGAAQSCTVPENEWYIRPLNEKRVMVQFSQRWNIDGYYTVTINSVPVPGYLIVGKETQEQLEARTRPAPEPAEPKAPEPRTILVGPTYLSLCVEEDEDEQAG